MTGFMAKDAILQVNIRHISQTIVNVAKTIPLFGGSQKCCMGVTTRFSYKASNFSCSLAQLAGASHTFTYRRLSLNGPLCKMDTYPFLSLHFAPEELT